MINNRFLDGPFPTRTAAFFLLGLLFYPSSADSSIIIDTSEIVIEADQISGIYADGIQLLLKIGDGIPNDVYSASDFPETPDQHGLPKAISTALVSIFNDLNIAPGTFSGCEPLWCALFIPQAYNSEREFYSFDNILFHLNTWILDEGDLRGEWTGAANSSVTLVQTVVAPIPIPSSFYLFTTSFLLLFLVKKKNPKKTAATIPQAFSHSVLPALASLGAAITTDDSGRS